MVKREENWSEFDRFVNGFKRKAAGVYVNGEWEIRRASLGRVWRVYRDGDWKAEVKNRHYGYVHAFYFYETGE